MKIDAKLARCQGGGNRSDANSVEFWRVHDGTRGVELDQNFEQLLSQIITLGGAGFFILQGLADDASNANAEHFRQGFYHDRPINNDIGQEVFDLFSGKFSNAARVSRMIRTYKQGKVPKTSHNPIAWLGITIGSCLVEPIEINGLSADFDVGSIPATRTVWANLTEGMYAFILSAVVVYWAVTKVDLRESLAIG